MKIRRRHSLAVPLLSSQGTSHAGTNFQHISTIEGMSLFSRH